MRLEQGKGVAELRPRAAYEAVDFGFLFVRPYYWRLVATGGLLILPLATLLAILFRDYTAWLLIVFWWLKPLWERALLFSLSRALFEDAPTVRETLRAFPSFGFREWFPALTIRRLSPTRSFDLPVTVLEGSTGSERGSRLGILHRGRLPSAAIALTILLAHVEIALFVGIVLFLQLLVPETLDWNFFEWAFALEGEPSRSGEFFVYYVELLVMLLVAPYYVVGGFSLYLHRRTELEAWDLELAFRRLSGRTRSARRSVASVAATLASVGLLVGASLVGIGPSGASAEELTPRTAKESIELVLADEAFHQKETISVPKFILDWEFGSEDSSDFSFPDWLVSFAESVTKLLGDGLEVLIVSLALGGVAWLVYRIAGKSGFLEGGGATVARRRSMPTVLFGLEVTEESLPEDLVGEALAAVRAGKARDALALLYRGALTRLALVYGADLSVGVTERECLEAARPLLSGEGAHYFGRLTRTWLRCAYGHIEPEAGGLESLCLEWSEWFGNSVRAEPGGVDAARAGEQAP